MREVIGKPNKDRQKEDFYATNPLSVKDIIEKENLKNLIKIIKN